MSDKKYNHKIQKARNTLLMIAMFSVVMLFAGLTSAYIVSKGALGSKWDYIDLPNMFYVSTMMILISGVFAYKALNYCKSNNFNNVNYYKPYPIYFKFSSLI